ncbi:MAG: sugar kinase [Lachnospiraceae bacterium]|nr:sugar kinase [Lachnospiraceae bacterium]
MSLNLKPAGSRSYDLLTMGEILLRLSPPGYERISACSSFNKYLGGAELNVASGAAQLGVKTGIISKIPDNAMGAWVRNFVRQSGVDDTWLTSDRENDARLGIYYYEQASHPRKPQVVYDRKNTSVNKITPSDFDESLFSSARCFHTSGITLALGRQCRETAIELMKRFKENGTLISFDVNFRGNLWSGAEAKACIEEILPLVDIFFCSDSTARLTFLKEGDTRDIMKSFTRDYPISVVASTQRTVHSPTIHSFGSLLYDASDDTFYEEEPYDRIEVVDRIGSGDSYIAGLLYGILSEPDNYQRALEYGNAISAVKNTIPGDLPCTDADEIASVIAAHKSKGPQLEMNR